MISLDYSGFLECVKVGGYILVADGLIALEIVEIHKEEKYVQQYNIVLFIFNLF